MMRASLLASLALVSLTACSNSVVHDGGGGSTTTSSTGGSTTSTTSTTTTVPLGPQPTLGQAIAATPNQWTWVPFDNAFCGNGSPTGIGVNLSSASSRVLIYLEGGGACWSDLTCYSLMTAANFTGGYGASEFQSDSAGALAQKGGFFDRTAAANPFKDYSYVYVPYCTGDIHAGNNVYAYPSGMGHHVGFTNMSAYLARIVPTFPGADRAILVGSSAGGFGAALNWWQTQQYFQGTRVDLIDDSGTPMPPDIESEGMGETNIRTQWNLAATLPKGCTECATRLDALFGFYALAFPDHRASLLTYVQDTTLPTFYGVTTAEFSMGLAEEITTYFTPNSGFQYFSNPGAGHVLWFSPTLTTGSTSVQQFVTDQVTDAKSWTSVH